jgi:hypothetical protein
MEKTKRKKLVTSKISKGKKKEYIAQKLEKLSWEMGEKKITYRQEIYDR